MIFNEASAQKDTSVYYLKNTGKVVSTKDSADFFLVILPPDTSVDKNLFIVKEFYRNGKIRLMGNSTTNNLSLKFQGPQITYFPNGHKMRVKNFENGEPLGDETEYYPNGKFYNKKSYTKTVTEETQLLLKDCSDSTGKVLAQNGNGTWIKFFNENFNKAYIEGQITNGLEEGSWHGWLNDGLSCIYTYKKGKIVSSNSDNPGDENTAGFYTTPVYPGGIETFMKFIMTNIKYPPIARRNGTQGRVIVSFVVERDGTLGDVKVARGIGDGCDEEAVRVVKLSPLWKPGYTGSEPVRVAYSVPISFNLTNKNNN